MIFSGGDVSDYDYEPWACWQVNVPLGKCWFLPTQGSKGSNLTPPNKVLRNFISIQIAKTHERGSTASGTYRYGSAVKAEWVRVTLNWLRCIRTFTAENISQRRNYRLQALSYTNYVRTLDTTWTGLWKMVQAVMIITSKPNKCKQMDRKCLIGFGNRNISRCITRKEIFLFYMPHPDMAGYYVAM